MTSVELELQFSVMINSHIIMSGKPRKHKITLDVENGFCDVNKLIEQEKDSAFARIFAFVEKQGYFGKKYFDLLLVVKRIGFNGSVEKTMYITPKSYTLSFLKTQETIENLIALACYEAVFSKQV